MKRLWTVGTALCWLAAWLEAQPANTPLVSPDDLWRFHRGTNAPVTLWKTAPDAALDASWLEGQGGFGYADSAPETVHCRTLLPDMKGHYTTLYVRKVFHVPVTIDAPNHLYLTVDWDDGFVAWLDGDRVAGANSPSGTNEPPFTATASQTHEHSASTDDTPNPPVTYDLGPVRLGPGEHVLALMGLNGSKSSRDFVLIADLAYGPAAAPVIVEGVADRQYGAYVDRVAFRVPTLRGYTYAARLDDRPVPTDVTNLVTAVDYHELEVWRTNLVTGEVTNKLVRFIVRSSERSAKQSTEDGLPPWTPWPVIPSSTGELTQATLRLMTPSAFPAGYEIPLVAWVVNAQGRTVRANGWIEAEGQESILVKRGVGSGFLRADPLSGTWVYAARLRNVASSRAITLESETTWNAVSGTLDGHKAWPAGSRVAVSGNLTIPATGSLTIGPGTVVRLDPAVNIYLDGALRVNGTVEQPVVFMPIARARPWGGFFLRNAKSEITASGTILTGSGADPAGTPGSHRVEQSLFHCTSHGRLTLTDCAAIALHGQLGHSVGADGTARYFFTYDRFLLQGATTGGEYEDAVFSVNDSAFIDCHLPAPPYSQFLDADEDGLYLKNIPAGYTSGFTNTLIGWTRDDGVDSGASGGGKLHFQDCWFESVYHEGNSLSGTGKDVSHTGDVFLGCGQAIEVGYGSPSGNAERCLIAAGGIGVRFGDNYDWSYRGTLRATNSIVLGNRHDVWGMNWQDWTYRASAMDIRSNLLSAPHPHHPANRVWDPAADHARLAAFLSTPPEAVVGVGFAVWTNRLEMASLLDGVPVGLSTFTTNFVAVDCAFVSDGGEFLSTAHLVFAPGDMIQRAYPAGFDLSAHTVVRVVLSTPVWAELTGETSLEYAGHVPPSQIAAAVMAGQLPADRSAEGLFLRLSGPSAQPIRLSYEITAGAGVLNQGTVVFQPGELTKNLAVPASGPDAASIVRVTLFDPTHASLTGFTTIYYLPDTTDRLLIDRSGAGREIVLGWWSPDAVLEHAPRLGEPWQSLTNASPTVLGPPQTEPQEFFRLRIP